MIFNQNKMYPNPQGRGRRSNMLLTGSLLPVLRQNHSDVFNILEAVERAKSGLASVIIPLLITQLQR